jgi:penicillin-binding protein 1C
MGGGNRPSVWRRVRIASLAAAATLVVSAGIFATWVYSLGPVPLGEAMEFSTVVVDRNGRLLRPYATPDGRWRLPATVKDVDPRYLDLLIAYEDKRFRQHFGVDPLAVGRAALQLVSNGRIVSGGSTLTMQVARLLEPRTDRTFIAKLRQAVRAVQLERKLTKDEILTLYLGLAPYGGNLEGTRAASLAYFGKEPRRLSLGEAALLVAIPQSPEVRRPDRSALAAHKARDRVLDRVALAGKLPLDEIAQAKAEPSPSLRRAMPALAPHASEQAAAAAAPGTKVIGLTIDATIQKPLEDLARERAHALGPDVAVAIMAVDHTTGEVLARVASADYFDERRAGQVDMTTAVRSPGSTLKPFIYGLAFEDGLIHPETLIEDRPIRYGTYAPENFDMTFQGTVTIRKALQM